MIPRWRHCLHPVSIDTLLAKRLTRKILKSDALEDAEHTLADGAIKPRAVPGKRTARMNG